jgi:hypothetical protein
MRTSLLSFMVILTVLSFSRLVCGKETEFTGTAKKTGDKIIDDVNAVDTITVAIIDFESKAPGNPDLGQQLGDILTARLSIYDQFRLVERQKLQEILKEQQLNLSGMVDSGQVVKVGKLLGARIMVFGRAFIVDRDLYLVAKVVGTETSQVKGVIAKGKTESNLSDIIDQLADKLADGLEKWAPNLLPKTERFQNKIKILKKQLKGKELPAVAIMIPEVHINRRVVDPAAQTEMKNLFKKVGFTIIEVDRKTTSKWVRDFQKDPKKPMPPDFAGVDIAITGEGFSEFGARISGLVSCLARLEVQATDCQSHRIIASERTTRRAVDLSEAIAGKTALQAAGHELAIKLIEKIAQEMRKEN